MTAGQSHGKLTCAGQRAFDTGDARLWSFSGEEENEYIVAKRLAEPPVQICLTSPEAPCSRPQALLIPAPGTRREVQSEDCHHELSSHC